MLACFLTAFASLHLASHSTWCRSWCSCRWILCSSLITSWFLEVYPVIIIVMLPRLVHLISGCRHFSWHCTGFIFAPRCPLIRKELMLYFLALIILFSWFSLLGSSLRCFMFGLVNYLWCCLDYLAFLQKLKTVDTYLRLK